MWWIVSIEQLYIGTPRYNLILYRPVTIQFFISTVEKKIDFQRLRIENDQPEAFGT